MTPRTRPRRPPTCRRVALLDGEQLVLVGLLREADIADLEVVEMRVGPPERDLKDLVEHVQAGVGGYEEAAPDRWFDPADVDPELEVVAREGHRRLHAGQNTRAYRPCSARGWSLSCRTCEHGGRSMLTVTGLGPRSMETP
jgi:hypothetical protein